MSVRKAAGLEPSGLMPPKLGEKVSREEVEAATNPRALPILSDWFGSGSLNHQGAIIGIDPATAGNDYSAFWICNYGKPGDVPRVTTAANDPAPPRAIPTRSQVGRFTIYASDMQDVERMADLLDGVIVLEAQSMFYECASRYLGYHVGFDHVGDGDIAPTYDAIWSNGKRIWVRRAA